MEIKVKGNLSLKDIWAALHEKLHEATTQYGVKFSRGATLYINPTNEFGDDVVPRGSLGEEVRKLHSSGPYKSAADDFKL